MKILPHAKSAEQAEPPAVDVSREAVAEQVRILRAHVTESDVFEAAGFIEALAADRDRHRTFVRAARAIVQAYAEKYPKFMWDGEMVDARGAHAWLAAEAAEIGTMRDGGDPKV